ncbi:MAG: xanthine dehydrogenase family protein molybdopterin-binding subunit, partial [Bauldia sp.]
ERREDERFLSGRSCFVDDVQRPGMLHAAVVRSSLAHARILDVDMSAAEALPGVVGVVGPKDLEGWLKPIPQHPFAPLPGLDRFLQTPLAVERALFVGEPVAVVVAESRFIAEDAADLVVVDYDPLEPVTDVHAALADRSILHPDVGTNVGTDYKGSKGNVEEAFARAAYRRKETFRMHRHAAVPMETRGMVAEWDRDGTRLRVWGAAKLLFRNRDNLAVMFGMPEEQIELIEIDVGGSFGVRGEFYPEDFLIPFAARKVGRPVKWIEDRREHLLSTNHSREMECTVEIAVDKGGIITGLRGEILVDMGAYARPNGGVAGGKGAQFMCGPYRIENAEFTVKNLATNKVPLGSYRGPGRFESSFFRERIVDIAAADLGIDPAAFRMRNLITPDLLPWDAGAMVPNAPKTVYDTGDYPNVMQQALDAFGYAELGNLRGNKKDGRFHGVGIGCFVESSGGGPSEDVRLHITETGRAHLFVGSSSAGQSHETTMAQILADELKFPYDEIDVFHGSTTFVKKGWGSYHSRSVIMAGSAIVQAVKQLREQVAALVAQRKGLSAETLEWGGGGVLRERGGAIVATLAELGRQSAGDPELRKLLEVDSRWTIKGLAYTFGTQFAHVAVDPETAEIEVVRFFMVEDVGRMINPAVVHGQTIGAAFQGLGASLMDELVYDAEGQLLTGSLADYLLPTSTDFPDIDAISLEQNKAFSNLLGAKGAGEGGIAAVGGAVANAVDDALRSLGVTVTELPLSPDKVAALIRQARARKKDAA